MDEDNQNNIDGSPEGSLADEGDNDIPNIPGDEDKLMIANQSV